MPPASHSQADGSVQQGLSAAHESFAFCKHRRAADKRYSLGFTAMSSIFRLILLLAISLSTAGCTSGRVEELEGQVAELESKLDEVRSKLSDAESEVSTLKSAVDDLNSAVDEFQYANWRTAVLSVQSAAGEVESAAESVETSVEDAVNAAN